MPFDRRWFYGDAVFIVDPWLWLVLGGAVWLGTESRAARWTWLALALATSAIVVLARGGIPRAALVVWFVGLALLALGGLSSWPRRRRAGIAALGLALACAYAGALTIASRAGSRWVAGELARQGVSGVTRLMVGPAPANPLSWEVVAETPSAYRYGRLAWLPRRLDLDPQVLARLRGPVVDAAFAAPEIQGTLDWMRFPFAEVEELPDRYVVHVLDARYARRRGAGFGALRVEIDRAAVPGGVTGVEP
jgi:inner membrane protein